MQDSAANLGFRLFNFGRRDVARSLPHCIAGEGANDADEVGPPQQQQRRVLNGDDGLGPGAFHHQSRLSEEAARSVRSPDIS